MTESLLINQDYTPPTVEPCPKCGSAHWIHEEKGFNLDRMECLECHTSIWGFSGQFYAEPALATWNDLSKERRRLQAELDATKDKLAKAVGALGDIYDGEPEWPDDPRRELEWCRNRAKRCVVEILAEIRGE